MATERRPKNQIRPAKRITPALVLSAVATVFRNAGEFSGA